MVTRSSRFQMLENIVSNYAYVGLMAGVTIFLTPLYSRWLGPVQWGAVALCITIQGLLFLLDAGLGQIAPREFASVQSDRKAQWWLFHRFLRIYGRGALFALVIGQFLVGWLVPLFSKGADGNVVLAVRLVICQFALTFANSATSGLWNGLQQQKRANVRMAFFMAVKHVGALGCVYFVSRHAWAYLLPFVVVGCVELLSNLRLIRSDYKDVRVGSAEGPLPSVRNLLSRAGGFGLAVLAGMLTTQMDRLNLAGHLRIDEFGVYALVATFGVAFMNLQIPLQKAFLPRVVAQGAHSARTLTWLVLLMCALPCLVVALFAQPVLTLWLHNTDTAVKGAPVLRLILIGIALNGMYAPDYTRLVVSNAWRVVLLINVIILCGQALLLTWLTPVLGMRAGGWSWLLCGTVQFVMGRLYFMSQSRQGRRHA